MGISKWELVLNSVNDPGPVIVAEGLWKSYGDVPAVRDLSFTVRAGTIFGLLGPNGAGKTTTINMLTTLLPIDSGTASVSGFDLEASPDAVRQVIGLAGQAAAIDEKLTARENLEMFGRLYKMPKTARRRRVEELIDQFRMTEYADRPVSTYSGGQRRRLDVVAALIASPPALFLDEPTTGLDPRSRVELWDEIRALADGGTAVVLTTQYLEEADRLADYIVIMDQGTVVAAGTAAELKDNLDRDVLEVHFGSVEDLEKAIGLLNREEYGTDTATAQLTIPVNDGSASSLAMLRRFEDAGIPIIDFHYRRPTLDDVFMSHTDEEPAGAEVSP
ncbi:MAG: ATP-binding cassette domain-containing protein [Acidimicrobiia bacterium]|nr:ATP-binding cassette domain-containing protein [Acidimicrobiia bacterium]